MYALDTARRGIPYVLSGALYVEQLFGNFYPSLEQAIELYEDDTIEYIDSLLDQTVLISVGYAVLSLAFFIGVIRVMINQLTRQLLLEIAFLEIVHRDSISLNLSTHTIKRGSTQSALREMPTAKSLIQAIVKS
ncbi:MAG: hypothetical protein V2I33_21460 [Kangiellaceae bacterium]|jgi:hypothetical protein|nr:hypothetical protein [Kangiellaceae bacterium]